MKVTAKVIVVPQYIGTSKQDLILGKIRLTEKVLEREGVCVCINLPWHRQCNRHHQVTINGPAVLLEAMAVKTASVMRMCVVEPLCMHVSG